MMCGHCYEIASLRMITSKRWHFQNTCDKVSKRRLVYFRLWLEESTSFFFSWIFTWKMHATFKTIYFLCTMAKYLAKEMSLGRFNFATQFEETQAGSRGGTVRQLVTVCAHSRSREYGRLVLHLFLFLFMMRH